VLPLVHPVPLTVTIASTDFRAHGNPVTSSDDAALDPRTQKVLGRCGQVTRSRIRSPRWCDWPVSDLDGMACRQKCWPHFAASPFGAKGGAAGSRVTPSQPH